MEIIWNILVLAGLLFILAVLLVSVLYFGMLKKRARQPRETATEKGGPHTPSKPEKES